MRACVNPCVCVCVERGGAWSWPLDLPQTDSSVLTLVEPVQLVVWVRSEVRFPAAVMNYWLLNLSITPNLVRSLSSLTESVSLKVISRLVCLWGAG